MTDTTKDLRALADRPAPIAELEGHNAHLSDDDPQMEGAHTASGTAAHRYATMEAGKAAAIVAAVLPGAHRVVFAVRYDDEVGALADLRAVWDAAGLMQWRSAAFASHPDAVVRDEAEAYGGPVLPVVPDSTSDAIEKRLELAEDHGRGYFLDAAEGRPTLYVNGQVVENPWWRAEDLRELIVPEALSEAERARAESLPQVASEGGRLFPVSFPSEDANEREGVVTYWLPFVDRHGKPTFLDARSWAFRQADASELAERTTWRYPDGTVWVGPATPARNSVWVLAITWSKGDAVSVHTSERGAKQSLAKFARASWSDVAGQGDCPAEPPADDDEAARLYFETTEDAWHSITETDVEDDGDPEPTPDDATVDRLTALAETNGVSWLSLSDLVHDLFSAQASEVNNDGPGSMVRALVEHLGVSEAEAQIRSLTDESDEQLATVACKFCHQQTPAATARIHDGGPVGECCWDERLNATA
ncbi:hypothetical protein ACIBTV_25460 [Micromonospora sp. NPDC049366]|uniref:hypothetical protein n=1 Tax=Micromonospora sp. NPDC049366 TaxID=3364271 RepID=UPI0037AEEAA3